MNKRKRNPVVEEVVDRVAAKPQPGAPITVQLTVMPVPIRVGQGGGVKLTEPVGHDKPRLLLLTNTGAWQPLILQPGRWELRPAPDDSLPVPEPPKIWLPS